MQLVGQQDQKTKAHAWGSINRTNHKLTFILSLIFLAHLYKASKVR